MSGSSYYRGIPEEVAQQVLVLPEPVELALYEEIELEYDDPDAPACELSDADELHRSLTGFALDRDPGPLGFVTDLVSAVRREGLAGLLSADGAGRLIDEAVKGIVARTPLPDPAITWALRGHHAVDLDGRRIWICTGDDVARINRSLAGLDEPLPELGVLRDFYATVPEAVEVCHT